MLLTASALPEARALLEALPARKIGIDQFMQAVAAEGGPPNRFLVQILQRDRKTTVKIYPGSDTEKTPGVKKLLALVAHQFITGFAGTSYGPTNLKEYLL